MPMISRRREVKRLPLSLSSYYQASASHHAHFPPSPSEAPPYAAPRLFVSPYLVAIYAINVHPSEMPKIFFLCCARRALVCTSESATTRGFDFNDCRYAPRRPLPAAGFMPYTNATPPGLQNIVVGSRHDEPLTEIMRAEYGQHCSIDLPLEVLSSR